MAAIFLYAARRDESDRDVFFQVQQRKQRKRLKRKEKPYQVQLYFIMRLAFPNTTQHTSIHHPLVITKTNAMKNMSQADNNI
uniref:Uncharacterized protein n=1 Tax=Glossina austeni TaxID=7395 RepID=A0A1A9VR63_GLOAU